MSDDDATAAPDDRRRRAEAADFQIEAERRRLENESTRAQKLVDAFVERAVAAGLETTSLTAKPWSGKGRYPIDVTGWYLRRDLSLGVSVDGRYYQLVVAPTLLGRWRGVTLDPVPPPLQTGKGGRDGESVALDHLLALRLAW